MKDLLRFITAGSVDDGKSTLIGRLLYDSKSVLADQLEILGKQSKNREDGEVDLALLTDGLRAEREQGITIDVAYKYFTTAKRKFIIADTPGHIQYTRNMVTGASTANLAVILVDARTGVIEQTRRHSIIAALLRIPHTVIAINKMDLVAYSEEVFNSIVQEYAQFAAALGLKDVSYIPLSALKGDNVVEASRHMNWYSGPPLLEFLEEVNVSSDIDLSTPRFSVQCVIRPQTSGLHDYRGYAGKVISGVFRKGDQISILPLGLPATIRSVEVGGREVETAFAPQSATFQLEEDVDVSRGDMMAGAGRETHVESEFDALVCWMDSRPLVPGNKYVLQHNSRTVRCVVRSIEYKLDVNTLNHLLNQEQMQLNDLARVRIKTQSPLAFDRYSALRSNGGAILIDETNHSTVGAVMID